MTEDDEAKLRAHVTSAMEALPAPDRGRLAAIEQGLPTGHRAHGSVARWLAAAVLGAAAAGAGAAYWLGAPVTHTRGPTDVPAATPTQQHRTATQPPESGDSKGQRAESSPSQSGSSEDSKNGQRRDSPVIYRR